MRKVSKALVVLLSVCLLFSLASVTAWGATHAEPNPNYARPDKNVAKIAGSPTIDGKIEDIWKKGTSFAFTQDSLKGGDGLLWTMSADQLVFEPVRASEVGGTAYVGWDENYFYFALEITQNEHVNGEAINSELWRGDCLQLQIGPDASLIASDTDPGTCARYEMGFALSTAMKNRRLGYQWFPEPGVELNAGATQNMAGATGDYYYYVARNGNKTVYEIALKYSCFGRSAAMKEGDVIPFSFALHINGVDALDSTYQGDFLEWAQGVVGGTEKNIASAARMTLVKAGSSGGNNKPVTTTKTPTTTKAPTTTKNDGGNTGSTTTKNVGGNTGSTTTKNVGGNTGSTTTGGEVVDATTTEAPTTTAPEIAGVEKFYTDDDATDVDDEAILTEIEKNFEDKDIVVKSYVPGAAKFGISADALEGVYTVDADGNYVALEATEEEIEAADGSVTTWLVYDVSDLEEGDAVYVVKTAPVTTTEAPTTTTKAPTTTKDKDSDGADATTTAPEDGGEGGSWWIWLLIAAAVVIAAVIIFIILKKKKEDDEDSDEASVEE